jgi:hypothetical protein
VPERVLVVLSDLIRGGWAEKASVEAFGTVFTSIFAAFKKAQPDRDIEAFANAAFFRTQKNIRTTLFLARFRDELLRTSYLTPVEAIVEEMRELPERVIKQIAQVLAGALKEAQEQSRQANPVT